MSLFPPSLSFHLIRKRQTLHFLSSLPFRLAREGQTLHFLPSLPFFLARKGQTPHFLSSFPFRLARKGQTLHFPPSLPFFLARKEQMQHFLLRKMFYRNPFCRKQIYPWNQLSFPRPRHSQEPPYKPGSTSQSTPAPPPDDAVLTVLHRLSGLLFYHPSALFSICSIHRSFVSFLPAFLISFNF